MRLTHGLAATAITIAAGIGGCVADNQPADTGLNTGAPEAVNARLLAEPVGCVIVAPIAGIDNTAARRLIEESVARHAFQRIDRVIGPAHRDTYARHLAVDAGDPAGLGVLAGNFGCGHVVETSVETAGEADAVLWMERTVVLTAVLRPVGGGEPVWRARAAKRAGDGGLPLSLFGLAGALLRAGQERADPEAWPRLVEDAVRTAFASLPDQRTSTLSRPPARPYAPARMSASETAARG